MVNSPGSDQRSSESSRQPAQLSAPGGASTRLDALQWAVEQQADGFAWLDVNGIVQYANPALARMYGYELSELIGACWTMFFDPADQAVIQRQHISSLTAVGPWQGTLAGQKKSGEPIHVDVCLTLIRDERGTPAGLACKCREASGGLWTKNRGGDSERALGMLVDSLPGIVYRCKNDPDWTVEFISDQVRELLGYAPLDFIAGRVSWGQLIVPDDRDRVWGDVQAAVAAHRPYRLEYRVQPPAGDLIWVWEQGQAVYGPTGDIEALEGFIMDITERRRGEAELAERERLLRLMQETGPACVKRVSSDGSLVYMNPAGLTLIEAESLRDAIGLSVFDLVTPEHRQRFEDLHRAVISGETRTLTFEILGFKGARRWMETYAVPFRNPMTGRIEHLAVSHDITARKEAEDATAQLRQKYGDLVHTVNGIVWEVDVRTMRFTFVSRRAEDILGYPVERWLTDPNFWIDHIHPDDQGWAPAYCLQETAKKSGHTFEYRMLAADGRTVWLRDIVSVIVQDDRPVTLRGVMVDVTERRMIEDAERQRLVRRRAQTNTLIELAKHRAIHEGDLEATLRAVTETAARLLGVGRAGIWLFDADRSALRLADLYDAEQDCHSSGTIFKRAEFPSYFHAIEHEARAIASSDAHSDLRTKEFSASYLTPLGIGAMLDAPIRLKGKAGGILCHEHLGGPRFWTSDEESLAASLATLVSLALEAHERRQAEQALQASEERFRTFTEYFPGPAFIKNAQGQHLFVNPAFEQALHLRRSDWEGKTNDELFPAHIAAELNRHDQRVFKEATSLQAIEQTEHDGQTRQWLVTKFLIHDNQGAASLLGGIALDVTERKQLEQRLRQAEKMESLGTLAGGIAHDFNNILAAIIGYTELAQDGVTPDGRARQNLDQVLTAGRRAKALVQQILAFSRQRDPQRETLDLAQLLHEAIRLLRASIPKTITMCVDVCAVESRVWADPNQLQQVILNLCSNAAHAMQARGGTLGLRLEAVDVLPSFAAAHPPLKAGGHVHLSVSDTGTGMAPEVLGRIFDPFFTTKEVGEGTGLGLSASLGIVTSHGGTITVESEPGRGSTFSVYLPTLETATGDAGEPPGAPRGGSERILFVDDEIALVRLAEQTLGNLGYRVTALSDPVLALEEFRNAPRDFDVVITDRTMPGMTGEVLAGELLRLRPSIAIILSAGFSEDLDVQAVRTLGIRDVLMKPLTMTEMDQAIRDALAPCGKPQNGV